MYYRLFLWASRLVPLLPRWLVDILPVCIGFFVWLFAVKVRKQATRNARHVLGRETLQAPGGARQLRRVVRGMIRNSMSNYLEAFLLPKLDKQEILRRVIIEHAEYLQEALALGKGVILVSAHFGPFEYLSQWFPVNGYQAVIPVEHLKDQRLLDLMVGLRNSQGVNFIPLGGSTPMRVVIQALRKNQIVLITADRAVVGESVVRDFFGAPARLPIGPVMLSMRTGAPLVVAAGWRCPQSRISGEFIRLTLALSEEERKQSTLIEGAVIKELEQIIRARPEQWLVLSKIWEDD